MTDPWHVFHQPIPELPPTAPAAGRLGRNILRDSRRGAYPAVVPGAVRETITSITHPRHTPVLDQGQMGSCTGNAIVGALATDPVYAALPVHPDLDEALAVREYCEAEIIDGGQGCPAGEDQGSSGQSVCKAAMRDGFISGYTWAQTLPDALTGLMTGPAIFGINWYSSFDRPDPAGIVSLPAGASVRGGHEIEAVEIDTTRELVGFWNSWGTGWGLAGRFYIPFAILSRLLAEDGDCIFPQPLTAPPTPVPVPVPISVDGADRALASPHTLAWAQQHHTGGNATAARDIRTWALAKGLWK